SGGRRRVELRCVGGAKARIVDGRRRARGWRQGVEARRAAREDRRRTGEQQCDRRETDQRALEHMAWFLALRGGATRGRATSTARPHRAGAGVEAYPTPKGIAKTLQARKHL